MTRRIMLIGHAFSGKTTQFWTMPGKKFAFLFDPKAEASLEGLAYDKETFFPANGFDTHLRTLEGMKPKENEAAKTYEKFNKCLQEGVQSGRWKGYDSIMLDSYSLLELLITQALMSERGHEQMLPNKGNTKVGKGGDNRDDYVTAKSTAVSVVAQLAYLGVNILMTAHLAERNTEKVVNGETTLEQKFSLSAIGTLRDTMSSFFEIVLLCEAKGDSSKVKYIAKTHATEKYPRLGVAGRLAEPLPWDFDMTLDWKQSLEAQGLGKLLKMTGGV